MTQKEGKKSFGKKIAKFKYNTKRKMKVIKKSFSTFCIAIVVSLLIIIGIVVIIVVNHKPKSATERIEDAQAFYDEAIIGSEGKVESYAIPNLSEIIAISELQTLSYHYNAINKVRIDHKIRYYVAYEGIIQLGINFDEVEITFDEENHIINVHLPRVQVTNAEVVADSLDYIFVDDSYDNENVFKQAFSLCNDDLMVQASRDQKLASLAKTNTEAEMRALIQPFIEEFYPEYSLVIEWEELSFEDVENPMESVIGGNNK